MSSSSVSLLLLEAGTPRQKVSCLLLSLLGLPIGGFFSFARAINHLSSLSPFWDDAGTQPSVPSMQEFSPRPSQPCTTTRHLEATRSRRRRWPMPVSRVAVPRPTLATTTSCALGLLCLHVHASPAGHTRRQSQLGLASPSYSEDGSARPSPFLCDPGVNSISPTTYTLTRTITQVEEEPRADGQQATMGNTSGSIKSMGAGLTHT